MKKINKEGEFCLLACESAFPQPSWGKQLLSNTAGMFFTLRFNREKNKAGRAPAVCWAGHSVVPAAGSAPAGSAQVPTRWCLRHGLVWGALLLSARCPASCAPRSTSRPLGGSSSRSPQTAEPAPLGPSHPPCFGAAFSSCWQGQGHRGLVWMWGAAVAGDLMERGGTGMCQAHRCVPNPPLVASHKKQMPLFEHRLSFHLPNA